jgi:hypothetical protein
MKRYRHYIGLDAHKANCYFAVMNFAGRVILRKKMRTSEQGLREFIRSMKGTRALVFEETALSQWLFLLLRDEVEHIAVCQAPKKQAKTDFRDAIELADLLRVNRLQTVYHGAGAMMELRDLVHGYDALVQQIVRTKNQLSALFNRSAMDTSNLNVYEDVQAIEKLPSGVKRFVARPLFEQIQRLEDYKARYLKEFEENKKSFEGIRLICSIPGFGVVLSNRVVGIMVTPHRFTTKYNLFSYAALIQHPQISDGKAYGKKKALSKRALKGVFKTAATVALRGDNAFSRKYEEMLCRGLNERNARSSITKSIAATVLGVWKSGRKYRDSHWEVRRRRQNPATA